MYHIPTAQGQTHFCRGERPAPVWRSSPGPGTGMRRLVQLADAVGGRVGGMQNEANPSGPQLGVHIGEPDNQPARLALQSETAERLFLQLRADAVGEIVGRPCLCAEGPREELLPHRLGDRLAARRHPGTPSRQTPAQIGDDRPVGGAGEPYQLVGRPRLAGDDAPAKRCAIARPAVRIVAPGPGRRNRVVLRAGGTRRAGITGLKPIRQYRPPRLRSAKPRPRSPLHRRPPRPPAWRRDPPR
mgnify:CR=1 FL=1